MVAAILLNGALRKVALVMTWQIQKALKGLYMNTKELGYRPLCQHVRAIIKDTPPSPGVKDNCSVLYQNAQLLMLFNEAFEVLAKWDSSKCK